ncbi:XRN 5'-3' exonuclease protein, putative [Babesia bigemina]|uniref:XRN 5'-3' exonuclease protein, putative n=1 Tax=Babesia bigemina TaxID=5866 RepID=A0A061D4T9_BABBI|nr:XRN 5'-3' exonuclease protein, putative [Babesia bigemina]CDR95062.1 XRN 5'-3' exonuclease protein, putative [Babesia bigemina]|eukprot:XP_012767248.1 XRN 5'-3' exonuclease protein, putative [Babesia bigemina]
MGVPTFYRWLCSRYPRVVQDVKDDLNERDVDFSDVESFGMDLLMPNPNGEFDNLYVDMNGLIHPCCHPEGLEQPPSEEVMFQCIFDYLDRLFYLVRPRKLLFLAIDGVAPRAKMNQQRSRRFKSAAEADLEASTYEKVAAEFASKNIVVPPKEKRWDSNVITPGTPFMHELSRRVVSFIEERRRVFESWSRIHVIYSDPNVPGEGEHKIMNFIRNQRHSPQHDPNTRHVLHGMDADLIMLGLATHEVNFYIIREIAVIIPTTRKPEQEIRKAVLAAQANPLSGCTKLRSDKSYRSMLRQNWKPMQFLRIPVLREYLSHQLYFPAGWSGGGGSIAFERCIDDLVLMCFFCGNDFLPHLPSVSIPGGSIDQMILLYQSVLPDLGDYLTNEGEINFPQVERFVSFIARVEDDVFRTEQDFKQRQKARRAQQESQKAAADESSRDTHHAQNSDRSLSTRGTAPSGANPSKVGGSPDEVPHTTNGHGTASSVGPLKGSDGSSASETDNADCKSAASMSELDVAAAFKKRCDELLKAHREIADPVEPIDLSLNDSKLWKAAYYRQKFNLSETDDVSAFAATVAAEYVKGMCWVLRYYYQGCASWGWFYPFHYAPFCSDLKFEGMEFSFDYGEPYTPFQQLLSVMPIRSAHCLPGELRHLMTDPESPIASFYPTQFREDPNGKRYKYQWVALLPFIEEARLLQLARPLEASLPPELQDRNRVRKDVLFVGSGGTGALVGELTCEGDRCEFVSKADKKHQSVLLDGAQLPSRVLRIEDLMEEGRNRGFNCDVAKRMITNVLGRGPSRGGGGAEKDRDVLRNFGRDFHQTQNAYNPHHHPSQNAYNPHHHPSQNAYNPHHHPSQNAYNPHHYQTHHDGSRRDAHRAYNGAGRRTGAAQRGFAVPQMQPFHGTPTPTPAPGHYDPYGMGGANRHHQQQNRGYAQPSGHYNPQGRSVAHLNAGDAAQHHYGAGGRRDGDGNRDLHGSRGQRPTHTHPIGHDRDGRVAGRFHPGGPPPNGGRRPNDAYPPTHQGGQGFSRSAHSSQREQNAGAPRKHGQPNYLAGHKLERPKRPPVHAVGGPPPHPPSTERAQAGNTEPAPQKRALDAAEVPPAVKPSPASRHG